ncbi:MAG: CDP-glycerol glycerophosphotransferase family protein [Bacteroidales bacterium]|nr:CDP-glycerol glycerophosphotransferase family protein [Bacteroidales bacterium]
MIKKALRRVVTWWLCRLTKIDRRKLLFMDYYGSHYGDSPRAISDKISELSTDSKIVWAFTHPDNHKINGKKIRVGSLAYCYHLYTCRAIVTNYRMPIDFKKRKSQIYVQTWHSALRLKMIERDAMNRLKFQYIEMAIGDSRQIDFLLSGCERSTEIFKRAFWLDDNEKILSLGCPRTDITLTTSDDFKVGIRQRIGLDPKQKIALYAPTFRNYGGSILDKFPFEEVSKSLGEEWQLLLRLHPHEQARTILRTGIIDVTHYDDVTELLVIADLLITDYSALMFDFMLTRRPLFLFIPDLDDYLNYERGIYFDIPQLPVMICRNESELTQRLRHIDSEWARQRAALDKFLNEMDFYNLGHSSEAVAKFLIDQL